MKLESEHRLSHCVKEVFPLWQCDRKDVPVDVEGLPWTGVENSLNSPSNGPLLLGRGEILLSLLIFRKGLICGLRNHPENQEHDSILLHAPEKQYYLFGWNREFIDFLNDFRNFVNLFVTLW